MININSISRAENLYLYPGSRKPKINPTNDRKQYKINSSDTLSLNCGQQTHHQDLKRANRDKKSVEIVHNDLGILKTREI